MWFVHVCVRASHVYATQGQCVTLSLTWRHNARNGVSNHQPRDCLLNRLFRRRSKKTSKLHVTGLCAGNSPVTGKFPAQRANNAEKVSIWWRRHDGSGLGALLLFVNVIWSYWLNESIRNGRRRFNFDTVFPCAGIPIITRSWNRRFFMMGILIPLSWYFHIETASGDMGITNGLQLYSGWKPLG